ncbi:glycoside hydrolase family 13 protein [Oscillatoria sp. FACHB-1407]|uniref:glycoside hydrolase family 13 protein n=2 Tax=Oscillatoria sp. FACHB-1407 TaxID=2692847 RepID=UPI00272EB6EB|nr:alpha-glucosidase [Oscillatoria sp. FACHB-1407]
MSSLSHQEEVNDMQIQKTWWKESVVYQIYPRSFYDSNGDGIGDLRGIIQKLDYLTDLGVDVIWLCPVYRSPNDDNGYDISDYQDIMPEFGTLADWEELLAQMHQRGIKLIMDLVVNHTSDEHPWFVESRKSKDNPYRDYYIWRSRKDGREPNNWASLFGGSAWQYDEATDEYYLHLFTKKQVDLNWENPKLRADIYAMMRWWLDKGIDGFRMDVINMISKAPDLPDAPTVTGDRYQYGGQYFINGPRLREFLAEMKREVLSKYDIVTVGEMPMVTTEHGIAITHAETGHLNMVFQFEHMNIDEDPSAALSRRSIWPWQLRDLKRIMTQWQNDLADKGWNSQYLSNHDMPRAVSRFGDDGQYRVESAKLLATFLHMLQGTPYIYQGEEIGMTNVKFPSIEDYRDVETRNFYREFVEENHGNPEAVMQIIHAKSRDNARTPLQWNASEQAGFTSGTPWIQVNPNYTTINVERDRADSNSIFAYYQELIRLRKTNPVIIYGKYHLILDDDPAIYAFTRTLDRDRLLVILNFTKTNPVFVLPDHLSTTDPVLLIANYPVDATKELQKITLQPFEARVYRLS